MNYKVALVSLGCSKNLVDSEVMLKIIGENDYTMVAETEKADIVIINTCGFIESAKQESIDAILEAVELKKAGKVIAIVAAGCLAERYNQKLLDLIPELDGVIGVGDYKNINGVLEKVVLGEKILMSGHQEEVDIDDLPRVISTGKYSAFIKIAEGCDNRCTYCSIPAIRGKYRSRKFEEVIKEAKLLAENGIKEIIVIAQDTTRYGLDLYGEFRLAKLLVELEKIEGIKWIRLLYSYPDSFTDELIEVISKSKKICHYLDIPVQHASDKVLKKMARRTSKGAMTELFDKLRKEIPDLVLRTSLIVGFPGESDEDFEELYDFVKDTGFDRMGVFTYSKEEGTPAYRMKNHLPEEIKNSRRDQLMLLQQDISANKSKSYIGKTLEVLVEKKNGYEYEGRSYMDAPEIDGIVIFKSKEVLKVGDFAKVEITEATDYDLIGETK